MAWDVKILAAEVAREFAELGSRQERLSGVRVYERSGKPGGTPFQCGEDNARAKLTEEQVRDIISSDCSTYYLARKHNVSPETVKKVRSMGLWKQIQRPDPPQMMLLRLEEED